MEQNTPEWLEMRKQHLGASDAPIIMGVSPWKTPFQLWEEKLGLRDSSYQSHAMKHGQEMEDPARQWYIESTGNIVIPEVVFHQDKNWMMASLDGKGIDSDIIIEIKNPGKKDHDIAKKGKIPEKYIPQLQHQLACCDLNEMHYVSFYNNEGIIVEVKRDNEYIDKLYEEEEEFWWKVKNLKEPEKTDKDEEAVEKTDDKFKFTAQNWIQAHQYLKYWEAKETQYRHELIEIAGKDPYVKGEHITIKRTISKGYVQYREIPEFQDVDLDKYRAPPAIKWRITYDKTERLMGKHGIWH